MFPKEVLSLIVILEGKTKKKIVHPLHEFTIFLKSSIDFACQQGVNWCILLDRRILHHYQDIRCSIYDM